MAKAIRLSTFSREADASETQRFQPRCGIGLRYVCYQGLIMLEEWDERWDATLRLAIFTRIRRAGRGGGATRRRLGAPAAGCGEVFIEVGLGGGARAAELGRGGRAASSGVGGLEGQHARPTTQRSTRCKLRI